MPLVTINYDTAKVSETIMEQAVQILVEGLATSLTTKDQDGEVVPKGVRVFVYERGRLDYSQWEIDITVMTNDLPGAAQPPRAATPGKPITARSP